MKIDYSKLDKECIDLCKTLNNMDGLFTTESCCGHLSRLYVIFFYCDNFQTLAKIYRSINRNYSDGKFELLVSGSDMFPSYSFLLRSKEVFKSEEEMNKSVNSLIKNLIYWSQPRFNDHFSKIPNEIYEKN